MHVILMVAITVDGKIARSADHYPDWTGKATSASMSRSPKKQG
ncbi:hypothetical protein [Desulfosarcina cetonica]|nr:hypothetical protein [Desulfosarcina cetonica]